MKLQILMKIFTQSVVKKSSLKTICMYLKMIFLEGDVSAESERMSTDVREERLSK